MINYKGKLLARESLEIQAINRGLAFGDGIFETMIFSAAGIALFDLHWNRLTAGLKTLSIDRPFSKKTLLQHIEKLVITERKEPATYRVKLIIWRTGSGKYSPESNKADFMLEANPIQGPQADIIENCFLSQKVTLCPSFYSHLKTISALNYVMASVEKEERGVEELLIKNHDGMLSEATSSNIFIYNHDDSIFYTPPLDSACIDGVMRRQIINNLHKEGEKFIEKHIAPTDITENTSLFLTNVAGIRQVLHFEYRKLKQDVELLSYLVNLSKS